MDAVGHCAVTPVSVRHLGAGPSAVEGRWLLQTTTGSTTGDTTGGTTGFSAPQDTSSGSNKITGGGSGRDYQGGGGGGYDGGGSYNPQSQFKPIRNKRRDKTSLRLPITCPSTRAHVWRKTSGPRAYVRPGTVHPVYPSPGRIFSPFTSTCHRRPDPDC